MSHIDDPTKTSPEQGAEVPAVKTLIPDVTTREFIDTLKVKTGKTEDELMALDDKTMQELMEQSFETIKGGKTDANSSESAIPAGKQPAAAPAEDGKEISVQVKPSLLKPFSTAGDLKQALNELVRKAKESNDTVDVLQKRTIPNLNEEIARRDRALSTVSTENSTLKTEIEALRKLKPADQPAAVVTAPNDEELPEIPDMGTSEDFDPFNPDDRKKFLDALTVMRKRDEIYSKKIKELSAQNQAPQPGASEKPAATVPDNSRIVDDEYQAARALQSNGVFGDLMRTNRDITAINNDYVDFGKKLATFYGIQKSVDENGLFTPEINKILYEYFNPLSTEGDKIRSAAKSQGIEPPADDELMALRRITTVRQLQKSRFKRDERGATVPISVEEAFAIAQGTNPNLFKKTDSVETRRQEAEKMSAAIENRNRHTTDIPPAVGAEITNVDRIPFEKFMQLLSKPMDTWSVDEANMVKAVAKANNMSDEEIKFLVDEQQKPKPKT